MSRTVGQIGLFELPRYCPLQAANGNATRTSSPRHDCRQLPAIWHVVAYADAS
jgi:hypothetical protein